MSPTTSLYRKMAHCKAHFLQTLEDGFIINPLIWTYTNLSITKDENNSVIRTDIIKLDIKEHDQPHNISW